MKSYDELRKEQEAKVVGKSHLAPKTAQPKLSHGESWRWRRIEKSAKLRGEIPIRRFKVKRGLIGPTN